MRNISNKVALKPRSSSFNSRSDMVWFPCIGGQVGSINLGGTAPITKGYPTRIVLASSSTAIAGQYVTLSSIGGMTELNGTWKVIYTAPASNILWLDVDSSDFSNWTSGGVCQHDVFFDKFGNVEPVAIQGTTTNIWDNKADGVTSHSAGTHGNILTTLPDCLDFSSSKFAVIGATVRLGATASSVESIISLGRRTVGHGNEGVLSLSIEGAQVRLDYRHETSATGLNSASYSTSLGTSASRMVAGIVDFQAQQQYLYMDGRLRDADTLNLSNAIGRVTRGAGLVLGGTINNINAVVEKFGASATTPSQGRMKDVFIWQPSASLDIADVHSIIRDYHSIGEWPPGV